VWPVTLEFVIAAISYAFVMSATPGPNNVMLLASGVNYGFRRTIPHMIGISCGVVLMLLVVGLGVGQLLQSSPRLYNGLKIASAMYLLWLAWAIANSGPMTVAEGADGAKPLTAIQAAMFQWINPKAWVMAVTATSTFTIPDNYFPSLLVVGFIFGLVNPPTIAAWTGFGVALRQYLQNPRFLRAFNVAMALLLIASMAPSLVDMMPM
jgi:threonine/homoserine/homoserine lactone efflux protein